MGLDASSIAAIRVLADGLVAGEFQVIRLEGYGPLEQVGELLQADPLGLFAAALALRARLVAHVGLAGVAFGFANRQVRFAVAVLTLREDLDFDHGESSLKQKSPPRDEAGGISPCGVLAGYRCTTSVSCSLMPERYHQGTGIRVRHQGSAIQLLSTPYVHFWGGLPLHLGCFNFFWIGIWAAICLLNREENVCILVLATFFWQYRSLGGSAQLGLTWCHKLSGVWTLSLSATSILNSLAGSKAISESDQKRNETAFIVGIEYAHT